MNPVFLGLLLVGLPEHVHSMFDGTGVHLIHATSTYHEASAEALAASRAHFRQLGDDDPLALKPQVMRGERFRLSHVLQIDPPYWSHRTVRYDILGAPEGTSSEELLVHDTGGYARTELLDGSVVRNARLPPLEGFLRTSGAHAHVLELEYWLSVAWDRAEAGHGKVGLQVGGRGAIRADVSDASFMLGLRYRGLLPRGYVPGFIEADLAPNSVALRFVDAGGAVVERTTARWIDAGFPAELETVALAPGTDEPLHTYRFQARRLAEAASEESFRWQPAEGADVIDRRFGPLLSYPVGPEGALPGESALAARIDGLIADMRGGSRVLRADDEPLEVGRLLRGERSTLSDGSLPADAATVQRVDLGSSPVGSWVRFAVPLMLQPRSASPGAAVLRALPCACEVDVDPIVLGPAGRRELRGDAWVSVVGENEIPVEVEVESETLTVLLAIEGTPAPYLPSRGVFLGRRPTTDAVFPLSLPIDFSFCEEASISSVELEGDLFGELELRQVEGRRFEVVGDLSCRDGDLLGALESTLTLGISGCGREPLVARLLAETFPAFVDPADSLDWPSPRRVLDGSSTGERAVELWYPGLVLETVSYAPRELRVEFENEAAGARLWMGVNGPAECWKGRSEPVELRTSAGILRLRVLVP